MATKNAIEITIGGNSARLEAELKKAQAAVRRFQADGSSMAAGLTSAWGSVATAAAGLTAGFGVGQAFATGLEAVEDFNVKVASLSAFITTFSKRASEGDLAGGFREAHEYAQKLIPALEVIDAKTIASGKDLSTISETMIHNGVLLDINNQKQVEGFTNIANALSLVTTGQNKDIQMRQEINALLQGQIRATDRLPKLLEAIDPQLVDHLKLWKQQGTIIENVGALLAGFGQSAALIENTWAAVGSSLETVRDRVLRDGFKPVYEDLLKISKDIRSSLVDADGVLTPLAKKVQNETVLAYDSLKNVIGSIKGLYDALPDWIAGPGGVGLAGAIMFGKKGAMVLTAGTYMTDWVTDMARLAGFASAGEVKWKQFWLSGHESRKKILADFEAKELSFASPQRKDVLVPEIKEQGEDAKAAAKALAKSAKEAAKEAAAHLKSRLAYMEDLGKARADWEGKAELAGLTGLDQQLAAIAQKAAALRAEHGDTEWLNLGLADQENAAIQADYLEQQKKAKTELHKISEAYHDANLAAMPKEWAALAKLTDQFDSFRQAVVDAGAAGIITMDTVFTKLDALDLHEAEEAVDLLKQKGKSAAEEMGDAFKGWASNMAGDFNDVLWGADLTFGQVAESFGKMISQMVIQLQVIKPLMSSMFPTDAAGNSIAGAGVSGWVSSLFPSANGNVFGPQGVTAFANGGIVARPTIFPFARGIGLMGEAGPEAIMPLRRGADGKLGVSGGGSSVQVNVINNATGTKATAKESTDGRGNRVVDVFIEQIKAGIAGDIMGGRGQIPQAMNTRYGLNPVAGSY